MSQNWRVCVLLLIYLLYKTSFLQYKLCVGEGTRISLGTDARLEVSTTTRLLYQILYQYSHLIFFFLNQIAEFFALIQLYFATDPQTMN